MTGIRLPPIDQPNSSAAIRAASNEPRPDVVDSGPFMSAITPIFIVLSPLRAGTAHERLAAMARTRQLNRSRHSFVMAASPFSVGAVPHKPVRGNGDARTIARLLS